MDPEKSKQIEAWIDGALQQYGEADPRAGLENRILASVRAERERAMAQGSRWWPVLAVVTAIVVAGVGIFLARVNHGERLAKQNAVLTVERPSEPPRPPVTGASETAHKPHRAGRTVAWRVPANVTNTRMDRFPSPQPLSEQEILLARYIEQFPREATLMARAQTELSRQETLEWHLPENTTSDSEMRN